MTDLVSVSAILGPSLVAILSLLIQVVTVRSNHRHERAKLFYQDRLKALQKIQGRVSGIVASMESVLQFKNTFGPEITFAQMVSNEKKQLPDEIHQQLMSAVWRATSLGPNQLKKAIEENNIFISDGITKILTKINDSFTAVIPNPLYPETIDIFIEHSIDPLRLLKDDLAAQCRQALLLNKG